MLEVLGVLSLCRKELVQRTLEHDHDLYRVFFEFESDMQSLQIFFEREKIQFINSNLAMLGSIEQSNKSMEIFHKAMSSLVRSFYEEVPTDVIGSMPMIADIFIDKLSMLDGLIMVNEKNNNRINSMKYQIAKDNRLFDREFKRLGKY